MFTTISSRSLQRTLRVVAGLVAVAVPLGLLIGGSQPVAVGLFAAPYDKLVHALVFAVLAAAMGYASGWRGWRMVLLAFGGALAVGVLDEWHQMALPGRSAGWDDLAADAVGAALGAWIAARRSQ